MSGKTLVILVGVTALVAMIVAFDRRLRGGKRRPLSSQQPKFERRRNTPKPELGMEAIDMDLVNEVNAQNAATERRNWAWNRRH